MIGLKEVMFLVVAIALPVWALLKIRSSGLRGIEAALWVIAVIVVPLLGPLAFLIVRPSNSAPQ